MNIGKHLHFGMRGHFALVLIATTILTGVLETSIPLVIISIVNMSLE